MKQLIDGIEYLIDLIELVQDYDLFNYSPNLKSRRLGEIVLHIIRSQEYYLKGVTTNSWNYLDYTVKEYDGFEKVLELILSLKPTLFDHINSLDGDKLHHLYGDLTSPTFGLNLMIELLYHQSEHLGQIQIYLRNNDIKPPAYPFLI